MKRALKQALKPLGIISLWSLTVGCRLVYQEKTMFIASLPDGRQVLPTNRDKLCDN